MQTRSYRLSRRREHTESFPDRYSDLVERLRSAFPANDRLLTGYDEMRHFLRPYGIVNSKGMEPSDRSIRRWRRLHGCPIVKARMRREGRHASSEPVTTSWALLAWLLSEPSTTNERHLKFGPAIGRHGAPADRGVE